jgi:hypothetical protein
MPAKHRTADQGEKRAVQPVPSPGAVPADKIYADEAVVAPPPARVKPRLYAGGAPWLVHLDPIDFFGELLSHW